MKERDALKELEKLTDGGWASVDYLGFVHGTATCNILDERCDEIRQGTGSNLDEAILDAIDAVTIARESL